jgi:hypothetical protein
VSSYQEFEEVPTCPGCGSPGPVSVWKPDIRRCHACGLYLLSPRPIAAMDQMGRPGQLEHRGCIARRLRQHPAAGTDEFIRIQQKNPVRTLPCRLAHQAAHARPLQFANTIIGNDFQREPFHPQRL